MPTVDELLALNEEIAALVRAGVPLEQGLADLGRDLPGGAGLAATDLADRLSRGEPLDVALAASQSGLPPLYLSIVAAGLKTGRLATALEGLTAAARRLAELRHATATALIYPVLVFLVGWGLFVGFVSFFAPTVLPSFRDFKVPSAEVIAWFAALGPSAVWWGTIGPAVVLLAVGVWWWQSRQAVSLAGGRWLGWIPGARVLLRLCHWAAFADILALLIDERVALPEALRLAARASGSRWIAADAEALAQALERGAQPSECINLAGRFPPLVAWFLSAGAEQRVLVSALRHAASSYHERARQRAEAVQTFLPVALTLGVGGTTVLAYALVMFLPWVNLLNTLSVPQ